MESVFNISVDQRMLYNFMEAGVPRETVMAVFRKTAHANEWERALAAVSTPKDGPETEMEIFRRAFRAFTMLSQNLPTPSFEIVLCCNLCPCGSREVVSENTPCSKCPKPETIRVFASRNTSPPEDTRMGWFLATPSPSTPSKEEKKEDTFKEMTSLHFHEKARSFTKTLTSVEDGVYCINDDLVFVLPTGKYPILVGRLIDSDLRTLVWTRPLTPEDWETIQASGLEYMTKHEACIIETSDRKLYERLAAVNLIPNYK